MMKEVGAGIIIKEFDGEKEEIVCTTVSDISTAVNIPERTLYNHFTQAWTGKGKFKKWEFGTGPGCILG